MNWLGQMSDQGLHCVLAMREVCWASGACSEQQPASWNQVGLPEGLL